MALAPTDEDRLILEEFLVRKAQREKNEGVVAAIKSELFSRQIEFIEDSAREKGALCTRRAGKTQMWSRYGPIVALQRPGGIVRVWGINRLRAKQLLWDDLKLVCARHKLGATFNETELTVRFPNRSEIRLLGADKDKEVQKKRGDKTVLEVVLEAQLFGPYLKTLVEEVASPCLFDLQGTFCLEGTPGPICTGYWYEVSGRNDVASKWTSLGGKEGVGAGWSMHRWSVLDNPHLPHARQELASLKLKRRWADDNPTYIREWLARWVNDLGSLFYKFNPDRNAFDLDQVMPVGPGWEHVLGWDLGFRDDMALVVWGYHPDHRELYEAFSWKKPGALAEEVVEQIDELESRGFNFVAKVADTGGGGRMYVEEVMSRYSHVFEAAKKPEKYDHVRLFNDDLLTGFVKLQRDSVYAEEIAQLARDLDWPPPEKPEAPPREDPRCANHCSDAGLYAYRRAMHYLHRDAPEPVVRGTPAWHKAEEKRMLEAAEQAMIQKMQANCENPDYYEESDDY